MAKIYLDQASTSYPKAPSVAQAVYDYLNGSAVNVNRGGYQAAYSVEEQIFETREQLLRLFHFTSGKGKNVIFTPNITTSLNILLKGLLKSGDHVLVSSMEHNAVMRPLVQLARHGVTFDRIPCSADGSLLIEKAEELLKPNTRLLVCLHASNVCGTIMPVQELGKFCKKHGLLFISLVLTGTMIMSLCNAGVTMIKYIADPNDVLQQITFWLMGSLTKTTMNSFVWSVIPMIIGLSMIFIFRWQINLLTLDEEEARSLGINIRKYRLIFIIASTLLSAAAVCLGGLIGWVGLMIPHLARALVGVDYNRLIPASAMLGGGYLILVDDIARSILSMELPLGVVTSIMGAPFFIYLIIKRRERA